MQTNELSDDMSQRGRHTFRAGAVKAEVEPHAHTQQAKKKSNAFDSATWHARSQHTTQFQARTALRIQERYGARDIHSEQRHSPLSHVFPPFVSFFSDVETGIGSPHYCLASPVSDPSGST